MNGKWKLSSLSLGVVASLATVAAPAAQSPACAMPRYSVTDLGVLGKGTNAAAFDMNRPAGWLGLRTWFPTARRSPSFGMAPGRWWTWARWVDPTAGRMDLTCMARPRLVPRLPSQILIMKTFALMAPTCSVSEPSGVMAN